MRKKLLATGLLFLPLACAQTQIDLSEQVRNALPYTSGGTNATSQVDARRNVGTPHAVATDFSGADIGEKINNACASFGQLPPPQSGVQQTREGTVYIPQGEHSYSTQILVPWGCKVRGAGRADPVPSGNTGSRANTTLIYNGPAATSAIVLAGSYSEVSDLTIQSSTGTGVCPSNGVLSWNPDAAGTNKWQCLAFGTKFTMTGATNASPIQITTSAAHGYATGDKVYIIGVRGNTNANGRWTVTVTGATTFTLNGSSGNGTYTSGGAAEKLNYSAAVPHLAAIQFGDTDPTVETGAINNAVSRVTIGNVTQGQMQFGIYHNGNEHTMLEDIYANGPSVGFYFTFGSQPVLGLRLSARSCREAGYWIVGASQIDCVNCLAESNYWFGGPPRPADLTKYGAGVRLGGRWYGDVVGAGNFRARSGMYFENNDIDVFAPDESTATVAISKVGSPSSQQDRGRFSGYLLNCAAPLSASESFVAGSLVTSANCIGSTPPPKDPNTTNVKLTVAGDPGETAQVFVPNPNTGALTAGYELIYPASNGGSPQLVLRSEGGGPTPAFQLEPARAADAVNTDFDSAYIRLQSFQWNGSSSVAKPWFLAATTRKPGGAQDSAPVLAVTSGASVNRQFEFRDKGVFRLLDNNVGDTPALEIGRSNNPSGWPNNNSTPAINFVYRSDAGTTGAHLTSTEQAGTANDGFIFVDARRLTLKGVNATTLRVDATGGQGANNLQEWRADGGAVTSYVSAAGAIAIKPSGSKPACDASTRFMFWTVGGGAGVKDTVEVCAKDASDIYAWRTIF